MADINQLSVPVTSRQHGILEPMRLQIVSNLGAGSPLPPSVVRENGAVPSTNHFQDLREELENSSSYIDGDKGSLEDHIAILVDDIGIKVEKACDSAESNKSELKILKKEIAAAMKQLGILASIQQLQFKTLLSVKSLNELRGMQLYLNNQEDNYRDHQRVYNCVHKEITDLISDSANVTQPQNVNNSSSSSVSSSSSNLLDSQPDLDENELELERSEPDLAETERGNNSLEIQPMVSENRASTPVSRPRQERVINNTETEVRNTVELNRKKNLILSNIPENLQGGDKEGIEIVLENIGCEDLFPQIENFTRLGEVRESGSRLIKLEMRSEEDVKTILANKDRLKDSRSPLVYINEDLSRSERARAFRARVTRRSTAAESLGNSGGEWGRNHALADTYEDFLRQQRHRTTNTGEMGVRGRRESIAPHQQRHQRGEGGALPEGWEVRRDFSSGRIYYMNRITREKQMEFPNEPARNYRQEREQTNREGYQGQNGRGPSHNNQGHVNNGTHMGNYGDWGYQGNW